MHLSPPARDDAIRLLDEPGRHLSLARGPDQGLADGGENGAETVKTIEAGIRAKSQCLKGIARCLKTGRTCQLSEAKWR
jgi:hypothetical protein